MDFFRVLSLSLICRVKPNVQIIFKIAFSVMLFVSSVTSSSVSLSYVAWAAIANVCLLMYLSKMYLATVNHTMYCKRLCHCVPINDHYVHIPLFLLLLNPWLHWFTREICLFDRKLLQMFDEKRETIIHPVPHKTLQYRTRKKHGTGWVAYLLRG